MKERLEKYIKKNHLFKLGNKLLLTISGGADSVALTYLLRELNYNFSLAHCNFGLRNKQSDKDEDFVKSLAKKLNVACFTKSFETKDFADENKISIQMAARDLRYNWFEQIRKENDFDFILTAHHRDDDMETFFINLLRGTSIKGMLGIHSKKGKVVRPFLFAQKQEIYNFLQKNKIEFREDNSNKEIKYLRNKIRLNLMPLLQEINPSISNTISQEMEYLSGVANIYFLEIETQKKRIIKKRKDFFTISIDALKKLNPLGTYLYEILKPFGFSNIDDIMLGISGQSGKQFFSATHRITIDRKQLIIQTISANKKTQIQINKNDKECFSPIHLAFSITENRSFKKDKNTAMLDYEKLQFPLVLRKWQKGDFFTPLGMKGKKKLSDFFVDNKISIPEKENIWVLCSSSEIIWVIGHRISEKGKISETTKKAYIVQLLKS